MRDKVGRGLVGPAVWGSIACRFVGRTSAGELGAWHVEDGNVTLTGHAKLTTSLESTERYLQYNWSPIVDAINSTIFMQAKATPTLVNMTIHMDLDWTGKSDYCSRHNTIKGDMRLDGNWTSVGGYFSPSQCT